MIDNLLDVITRFAWFIFAGYVIIYFVVTVREHGLITALIALFSFRVVFPLVLVTSINFLSLALVFIEPQEVGVVISVVSSQGIRSRPLSSGLQWIVPVAERVATYPIYWQTYTMSNKPTEGQEIGNDSIRARTRDGQEISLDCSLIFRIDPSQAVRVHVDWQQRYIEDFIRPLTRGIVRREVSQFNVDEVNSSQRKDLEDNLDGQLRAELEDKGLILDQFLLRDITFSPEYSAAIEQKQVALEERLLKEYQADQIERLAEGEARRIELLAEGEANKVKTIAAAEAQAIKVKAQAQANALRVLNQILNDNPHLLTYEYIAKLTPQIKVMLLPNNAPFLFPLPELEGSEAMTTTLEVPNPITPTSTLTPTLRGR